MEEEIWKPIPEFEGFYEASTLGRIRRLQPNGKPPRILKHNPDSPFYQIVSLHKPGVKKQCYVHRVIMAAFHGPRPPNILVNHKDFSHANNRLDNLEYCTHAENMRHSIAAGRINPSEKGKLYHARKKAAKEAVKQT